MENNRLPKICPVCGYDQLAEPPYDKWNCPSYEICCCCGFEYGFDDSSKNQTFISWREAWINKGFPFYSAKLKPKVWDKKVMAKQLENVIALPYKPYLL